MKGFIVGVAVGMVAGFFATTNAIWNAGPDLQESVKRGWRQNEAKKEAK